MRFIDIHNHCTWGIDDGIPTKEACQLLFEQAKEDGIQAIIATPHFIPGRQKKEDVKEMALRMQEAYQLAQSMGIDYFAGCEVFLNYDFLEMIDNKWFFPLANSHYVLCEFNVREKLKDSTQVEDRLYELIIRGYTPVVAHVERYFHTGIDLERVQKWIDMGCKIQVNRTSLLGDQGKQIQKNALQLLQAKMVHVVASDAHRTEGTRICQLSDAYEMLCKKCGEDNARLLVRDNPLHIIRNEELETMEEVKKSRGFWFRRSA